MYRRCKLLWSCSRKILSCSKTAKPNELNNWGAAAGARYFCLSSGTQEPHQTRPSAFQAGTQPVSPPGAQISAQTNPERRMLQIEWEEGDASIYPYVWLRDNCQCPKCFHPSSLARQTFMEDLDLNVEPSVIQTSHDDHVHITWDDGHLSIYEGAWLRERDFRPRPRDQRSMFLEPTIRFWGSELTDELKPHEFEEVMADDDALYTALHHLARDGLIRLQNVPLNEDQVQRLVDRVAYVKATHYGHIFEVKVKPTPSNLAYAANTLSLHQDLPFNRHMTFMQILHCLEQVEAEGGDSTFADGFHVANQLKYLSPEAFLMLQTQPVDFIDRGTDFVEFDFRARHHTIDMMPDGRRYKSIYYNQAVRDSAVDGSPDDVVKLYEALKQFDALLNDSRNKVQFKMEKGDMVMFANHRAIHGRLGFKVTPETSRHIHGCYVEWDATMSKLRLLARRRGTEAEVFAGNNY